MLLGAHANDLMDKDMQVTIAFNTFGAGLTQRMPRFPEQPVIEFILSLHLKILSLLGKYSSRA